MLADQIHHSSEYHQAEIFPEGQFVTKHWIFFQWTRLLVPWWLKWLPKTIHWCWKVGTWVGHIHPLPSQRVSDEILRNRIGSILEVEFPNVATFLVNNTQRNGYLEPFWHLTYFKCGLKGIFGINIWRTSMVLVFQDTGPQNIFDLGQENPIIIFPCHKVFHLSTLLSLQLLPCFDQQNSAPVDSQSSQDPCTSSCKKILYNSYNLNLNHQLFQLCIHFYAVCSETVFNFKRLQQWCWIQLFHVCMSEVNEVWW